MSTNPVCWWELASHDAKRTVDFLKKVFDWNLTFDEKLGFYLMPTSKSERQAFGGGGVFTLRKAKLPFMALYIRVDDIEDKARLIEASGGFIVEGPFEIQSGAQLCLFNEPSGVTFAMIQPATDSD
jgi:predicted enzyme related to lactoylglutathione lyase